MLHKHLKRILSLQSDNLCFEEARKKFTDTYMLVNGSLAKIKAIQWTDKKLVIENKGKLEEVYVKELEPFLPDTGLYRLDSSGQALFVIKVPKRQWLKSFSETYYDYANVGQNKSGFTYSKHWHLFSDMSKSKRMDFFVDADKYIWYHTRKIGYVKDSNTLICEDSRYIQELKDWSRDT